MNEPYYADLDVPMRPRHEWDIRAVCLICRQLCNIRLQPVAESSEAPFICASCVGNWAGRVGGTPGISRRDRFTLLKVKALSETLRWSSINGPLP